MQSKSKKYNCVAWDIFFWGYAVIKSLRPTLIYSGYQDVTLWKKSISNLRDIFFFEATQL